jgi:hypothetical protein
VAGVPVVDRAARVEHAADVVEGLFVASVRQRREPPRQLDRRQERVGADRQEERLCLPTQEVDTSFVALRCSDEASVPAAAMPQIGSAVSTASCLTSTPAARAASHRPRW